MKRSAICLLTSETIKFRTIQFNISLDILSPEDDKTIKKSLFF